MAEEIVSHAGWLQWIGGIIAAILTGLVAAIYQILKKGIDRLSIMATDHEARIATIESVVDEKSDAMIRTLQEMRTESREWREHFTSRMDTLEERLFQQQKGG